MIRKVFSLLPVVLMMLSAAKAQTTQVPCTTTEVNESYRQSFPEIAKYEEQLKAFITEGVKSMNMDRARGKGTAFGENDTLHIPVVVHVVHDYGSVDYVSDDDIYQLIDQINEVYLKMNSDTSEVIAPFKPYIGNPKMMFHLATKDPLGRPTKGITRRRSYLTAGGDDQAKFDQWDPASYLNIWTIRAIGRGISNGVVAAYAVFPSSAAAFPYTDGIITSAGSMLSNKTIPHEIGHILNLYHTWGNIQVATNCTGDDEVDDTPPTTGHFGNGDPYGTTANGNCNNASLYDTSCTNNVNTLAKILLDSTLAPAVDNSIKGFDYIPRTNLTLESVKIYPSTIGDEFEITHYKSNSAGVFSVVNVFTTKSAKVGMDELRSTNVVSNIDSPVLSSAITFNTQKYIWIDSFKIYPSTIGDTFVVTLRKFNNNLVKSYTGVTTTNTGAQVVPFSAFIQNDGSTGAYRLQIERNPGLRADTITKSTLDSINSNANNQLKHFRTIDGVIAFNNFLDTTGQDAGTTPGAYKGRYNFFYDWSVRYDALTTTDSGAQLVQLGYKVVPDTTFRLVLTKNPGVYNDEIGVAPYVRSIPCVINIFNDTSNGRYNLLYDLKVRYGYIKNCIDYPDTVNTQNIMDYANCPKMFTRQQVDRMRATLASNIGNRNSLVNDTTHLRTGLIDYIGGPYGKRLDMTSVPDLSVEASSSSERAYFLCAGTEFQMRQRSWRDTITYVKWDFTNSGPNTQTIENTTPITLNGNVKNTFSQPGWVNITLTSRGNNTNDSVKNFDSVVYVADGDNKINPVNGYFMDFEKADGNNPIDKYPIFNYYKNDQKWVIMDNVGYTGSGCISYRGFDTRVAPAAYNGTPKGDYDDFFTPAFDLSGMKGTECRLNFMSSGAFRVSDERLMRDTLQISFSLDCGRTWNTLKNVAKRDLANKGVVTIQYSPLYYGDWKLQSIDIPAQAREARVFFRFRFKPGVDDINGGAVRTLPGTGNHFYIDRINISPWPEGVNTLLTDAKNIALAPNPTTGSSQLVIKSASQETAQIMVTDVTGKVVYTIQHKLNGSINTIEIPAQAIKVKGVYMVHVQAGTERFTEKLVSY